PVLVQTPFLSILEPEMRLQRAVGMWRALDMENLRVVPSYAVSITILPFPTAWADRFAPNPWTFSGVSNTV
ncbi:hypothetical protein B0H12DRAFT_1025525, partial [Mycena haematopus]